ncbi:MAG TPA: hypothetical protein P5060_03105 [Candidatus Absconditabacterales bacterium]|nr:hypothetical protein [Candidatus Absconditabacterales bacterium]
MIRKSIIKRNINASKIHHVIGHNGSVFFKLVFKYILILAILILIFLGLNNYVQWEYMSLTFAAVGLILFVKFCIDFLNIYLDALVLTESGIVLYLREGLLEYKTEIFDWERIETISHNQKGFWDKLFLRGDIMIRLEHGIEFPFEDITYPKKQAAKISQLKDRFVLDQSDVLSDNDGNSKKFDVLVEALGEVVKDYIDKGEKKEDDFDGDFDYGGENDY